MAFSYEFPRAALTVDCVVFGLDEEDLKVLLIQRDIPPFEGRWALPGGFVRLDETLEAAAARELAEETGIRDVFLEQLFTFGEPHRDPRERVVTVSYYALVNLQGHNLQATTDARTAAWFALDDTPALAFDHDRILQTGYERLKGKVRYQPIGFELLPQKFTLRQLQHLYEKVLDRELDKRNFRKKILGMELLEELDEVEQDVAHRGPPLPLRPQEVRTADQERFQLRNLMHYLEAPTEYAGDALSVYLGGGISDCENWQRRLVELLSGSDLVVLNPRRANFPMDDPSAAREQIEWEHRHLRRAAIKLFWFPPQTLCPITLFELGAWSATPAPLVVGCHPEYRRREDVRIQMELSRPDVVVADRLEDLAEQVLRLQTSYKPLENINPRLVN